MSPSIQKLYDNVVAYAVNAIREHGGLDHTISFHTRTGKVVAIACLVPEEPDEQYHMIQMMRLVGIVNEATAVVVATEVYFAKHRDGEEVPNVRDHPDAQRGLATLLLWRERGEIKQRSHLWRLDSTDEGTVELKQVEEFSADAEADGWLTELLCPRTPSGNQRRKAQAIVDAAIESGCLGGNPQRPAQVTVH